MKWHSKFQACVFFFAVCLTAWILPQVNGQSDQKMEFRAIELPTTAGSLRQIENIPNGGKAITTPGAVIEHVEYRGYAGAGVDGRCIMVFAPRVTLYDYRGITGNDDNVCLAGDTRGFVGLRGECVGGIASKSVIAYTDPSASNQVGPIYGAADGYAGTFYDYKFDGGERIVGGIYNFIRCRIMVGPLGGVQAMDALLNFIDCDFVVVLERASGPDWPYTYWYQPLATGPIELGGLDPCCVRVQGLVNGAQASSPINSRLHFSNCRLHIFRTWSDCNAWKSGKEVAHAIFPADGPTLCRRFANAKDVKAKRTAYGLPGSVPAEVFVKEPLFKGDKR